MSDVTNGPLSWRDVYAAVNESEGRVLKAIERIDTKLDTHETRIGLLEEADIVTFGREQGIKLAVGTAKTVFYLAVAAVSAAGTVMMILAATGTIQ